MTLSGEPPLTLRALAARVAELEERNAQLQEALSTRIVIEQAKGLIAGAAGADIDEAFRFLRTYARDRNRPLSDVCQSVVKAARTIESVELPSHLSRGRPEIPGAETKASPSPARLSHTPLFSEIMETWRDRAKSMTRAWRVPTR